MTQDLIGKFTLISDQVDERELKIILEALSRALRQTEQGSIVEFGCYVGTTSLFISRLLNMQNNPREYHVYDSFEGLPEKQEQDLSVAGVQFKAGELKATKKQFILNYKKSGLKLPIIHKAWFSELKSADLPDKIAFAFLDGDYYESIATSLQLIWPRLEAGAIVVVDDYANEALPGAARAVDEWLKSHRAKMRVEHSLAVIEP